MLTTCLVGAGSHKAHHDWPSVWKDSEEAKGVQKELDRIHEEKKHEEVREHGNSATAYAMPITAQIKHVTIRVFQQYWRTPSYIYAKFILGIASALFIGFSFFLQNSSSTGLQNTLFAIFMLTSSEQFRLFILSQEPYFLQNNVLG
jgi:ATP-binding cassette subfamily G (WHITE) protein 2 (PDR)